MPRKSSWDGVERRNTADRRSGGDRRGASRPTWERRSGHDRRGHKLYSPLLPERGEEAGDQQKKLAEVL